MDERFISGSVHIYSTTLRSCLDMKISDLKWKKLTRIALCVYTKSMQNIDLI